MPFESYCIFPITSLSVSLLWTLECLIDLDSSSSRLPLVLDCRNLTAFHMGCRSRTDVSYHMMTLPTLRHEAITQSALSHHCSLISLEYHTGVVETRESDVDIFPSSVSVNMADVPSRFAPNQKISVPVSH